MLYIENKSNNGFSKRLYGFPSSANMSAIPKNRTVNACFAVSGIASQELGLITTLGIYVDDVLKYSKSNFTRTTEKVHVNLDVKNGEKLEIRVTSTSRGDICARIAIVNAQLTKYNSREKSIGG